jgi:hypothetical protein
MFGDHDRAWRTERLAELPFAPPLQAFVRGRTSGTIGVRPQVDDVTLELFKSHVAAIYPNLRLQAFYE